MADIDLKTLTPDTSLPTTGYLFGADSQATANPSVYSTQTVATTLLGSTSLTGDTLTASAPVLNLAQTWSNAAVTFKGVVVNATDTTSAAASLLIDLQITGTSKFSVKKDGSVSTGIWQGTAVGVAYGGTGQTTASAGFNALSPVTTTGDLIVGNGTNSSTRLGIGSTSQVLTVVGGTAAWATPASGGVSTITFGSTGLTPSTATSGAVTVAGTLAVASGGTGLTTTPANGALDIGNGTGFTRTTLTAGSGITITNGAGSISIAASGGGTVTSVSVTTANGVSGTVATATTTPAISLTLGDITPTSVALNGDAFLVRDAANILAQRNGVTSQAFRVYNTYTDASNYERGVFDFKTTANVLTIGTEKLGTGATRNIQFLVGGVLKADYGVTGSNWTFTGNIQTPNSIQVTFDISLGRYLSLGPNPYTGGSTVTMHSATSGILQLSSGIGIGAGFDRIQFGGTTTSFPALKRSTTFLQARLADDSAFTNIQGKLTTDTAYTAGVLTATGYITIYDSTGTAYRVPCLV